jgi:hypothetical protein
MISVADAPPSTTRRTSAASSSISSRESRRLLAKELAAAAATYQVDVVIPHCAECTKPCCPLDPLVLELDWKQLKSIWQIEESRKYFDRRLCSCKGPEEIRAGDGLDYANEEFPFLVTLSARRAAGTAAVSKRQLRDQ